MSLEAPDPRLLPEELLGFPPRLIADAVLPCGQLACTPLRGDCIQVGPNPDQAVILAGRQMGYEARTSQLELERQLLDRLSIDQKTGIFTYNTVQVLFERMLSTGLLAKMRHNGYTLETMVGDLDKMKTHNLLGDHDGGDAALLGVIDCLLPLYRRKGDLMAKPEPLGLIRHEREMRDAVTKGESTAQMARFANGDEVIGMSFLAPTQDALDRRQPLLSLNDRAEQITVALRDARVRYPLRSRRNPKNLKVQHGKELDFDITDDGYVDTRVSATFAIARSPIPDTLDGFFDLFTSIDHAMGNAKRDRTQIKTRVVTLNLLAVE